jgi:arylsulfatase A-like enzyme
MPACLSFAIAGSVAGLVAAASACAVPQESDAPRRRPSTSGFNVLLVTLDTTRADRLGCYGHERARTPVLDALAKEGTRFDEAIATNGLTPMAHASILTGVNPYRHDLRVFFGNANSKVAPDVPVLPEVLRADGWATGAFVSAYPVSEAYGFERGFDVFDSGLDLGAIDLTKHMEHEKNWVDARSSRNQRRADATTDRALAWLGARDASTPWFCWVHYFDVHDYALVPPIDFAAPLGGDFRKLPALPNNAARRDWIYDVELAFVDAQVGRIVEALGKSGALASTVVVVIGDHGQGLLDGFERHGWMLHTLPYQWCLRVPLIVRLPAAHSGAESARGRVVADLVRAIDVFPTILEAVGKPAPVLPAIEGESLLPLMEGEDDEEPRIAYADALTLTDRHAGAVPERLHDDLFVAMDRRWKLVFHSTDPAKSELFDLGLDPLETRNVAVDHGLIVEQMRRWLDRRGALSIRRPARPDGAESEEDARRRRMLEALGYGGDAESEEKKEK